MIPTQTSFQAGADGAQAIQEISSRFQNKRELYLYLTRHGKPARPRPRLILSARIFLPHETCTSLAFLRAVFSGTKKALRQDQVPHVTVPAYPELSMGKLWDFATSTSAIVVFLPDVPGHQKKLPDKDFFFGIVAAQAGPALNQMIREAQARRASASTGIRPQLIQIQAEWVQTLTQHPYFKSTVPRPNPHREHRQDERTPEV